MRIHRRWWLVPSLLLAAAFAVPAAAQTQSARAAQAAPPAASAGKAQTKPKTPAAKADRCGGAETRRAGTANKPAAAATMGGVQPKLLGQYADWGAYTASPGGKKVCFAIAKPSASDTVPPGRPRNPAYMFIATRPAEKVTNEVSVVIGYPFKPGSEASADVGSTSFALYTQQDGAWIKNAADEAHMIDAMRGGQTAVVKGASAKGTQSTDTFTLKGLSQALDRTAQECK